MASQEATLRRERRAHVRYPHTLRTSCRPLGKETGASWVATVKVLSRNGVLLVMNRAVRPGVVLVVALERLGGRFAQPLLMRVMDVRGQEETWEVGCSFVKPLTDNDIQALLLTAPP